MCFGQRVSSKKIFSHHTVTSKAPAKSLSEQICIFTADEIKSQLSANLKYAQLNVTCDCENMADCCLGDLQDDAYLCFDKISGSFTLRRYLRSDLREKIFLSHNQLKWSQLTMRLQRLY